ncbi:hypothetical protein DFH29DRAFT_1002865 [Suillus ampliporus]|nr:hypothetical protein DFH29DRAFT_1002865 [Suillus ampliporus]
MLRLLYLALSLFLSVQLAVADPTSPRVSSHSSLVTKSKLSALLIRGGKFIARAGVCPTGDQQCNDDTCCALGTFCCNDSLGGCCPTGSTCIANLFECSSTGSGGGGGSGDGGGGITTTIPTPSLQLQLGVITFNGPTTTASSNTQSVPSSSSSTGSSTTVLGAPTTTVLGTPTTTVLSIPTTPSIGAAPRGFALIPGEQFAALAVVVGLPILRNAHIL